MIRRCALVVALFAGAMAVQHPIVAQQTDEAAKWIGIWETQAGPYKEYWKIDKVNGQWFVNGVYLEGREPAAIFTGQNATMENGTLTFTKKYSKKPNSGWKDASVSAVLEGEKIQFTAKGTTAVRRVMAKTDQAPQIGNVPTDFIGQWTSQGDGLTEVWNIQAVGNKYVIQAVYFQNNMPVGGFVGVNPTYANGQLVFLLKFTKKPRLNYKDNLLISCTVAEEKLKFTWVSGGSSGKGQLDLIPGTGYKVGPKLDANSLVGNFEGEVDGFKEIWSVSKDGDKWAVKGVYLTDGKEVGSFVGKDPKLDGANLVFTQDLTQKPPGVGWFDGAVITATPSATGMTYVWQVGAFKSTAPRIMIKGRR